MDTERVRENAREALPVLVVGVSVFALLAIVGPAVASVPSEGNWSTETPLPVERDGHGTAAFDGSVYVVGGADGPGVPRDELYRYDEPTDSWTALSNASNSLQQTAAASLDGTIIYGGGYNSGVQSVAERYYPGNDTWVSIANLPDANLNHEMVSTGGYVYVAGGNPNGTLAARYSPGSDSWSYIEPLPSDREQHGMAVVDGEVYAIGGDDTDGNNLASVVKYDPSAGSWTSVASLGGARAGLTATTVGGTIIAAGGEDADGNPVSTAERYYPGNDTWVTIDSMPSAVTGAGSGAVGDEVFVVGGADASGASSHMQSYLASNETAGGGGDGDGPLEIDTRDYLEHNTTVPFRIWYQPDDSTRINVTTNATVTVENTSVVTVDQTAGSMTSTSDVTINQVTWVNATHEGETANHSVVVANETIENIDILPPMQKWTATIGDDNTLVILVATAVAAGVALYATSLAGLGAFALVIIGGWLGGFTADHTVISALLVTLFVGLNVSQLVEFDRR